MRQHVSCSIDYSAFKHSLNKEKSPESMWEVLNARLCRNKMTLCRIGQRTYSQTGIARASKFGCISCKNFQDCGKLHSIILAHTFKVFLAALFLHVAQRESDSESDTVYFLIDVLELVPAYKPRSSAAVLNPDYTLLHLGIQRHLCSC